MNMSSASIEIRRPPIKIGKTRQDELSESIKLIVDSSESVNDRRQGLNSFFLTVHVGLLAAIGFTLKDYVPPGADWPRIRIAIVTALIAWFASTFCHFWIRLLKNYQNISDSKVQILRELEKERTVRPFTKQYEIIEAKQKKGEFFTDLEIQVAEQCRVFHHLILFLAIVYALTRAFAFYAVPYLCHI